MALPSRLPSPRKPAHHHTLSLVEGVGPSMKAVDLAPLAENPKASLSDGKKSKRHSLLPQFSRKVSREKEPNASEDILRADNGNIERSFLERSSYGNKESRGVDRTAMPPPTPRMSLGRPRPVSMLPSSVTSSTPRPETPVRRQNTSIASASAQKPGPSASGTGVETPKHGRASTIDYGISRASSTRMTQSPRPAVPSRTTSVRPLSNHGRPTSAKADNPTTSGLSSVGRTSPARLTREAGKAENFNTVKPLNRAVGAVGVPGRQSSIVQPHTSGASRSTAAHARTMSAVSTSRSSPPRSSTNSKDRPMSTMGPPAFKPAFTTYQQHYSPAKSALPKPSIPPARTSSAKMAPASSIGSTMIDVHSDLETTKQHVELLQLSILHDASIQALSEYGSSAKRKLSRKHAKLSREYESVRVNELHHQRVQNLMALDSWCPGSALLAENLQILSMVFSDLSSFNEEGSRHKDLVTMFELWLQAVETRSSTGGPGFVQPLDEDWRSTHSSLMLKLRSIQRNLNVLPPVPPCLPGEDHAEPVALMTVMKACRELVEGMLRELEIMNKVEKEVLAREKWRVDNEARNIAQSCGLEEGGDEGASTPWTPAWQRAA